MPGIAVSVTADVAGMTREFGRGGQEAEKFKTKLEQVGEVAGRSVVSGFKAVASGAGTVLTHLGRLSSVASSSAAILSKFSQGNEELKKRFESLTITLAILAPALSALGPAIAFLTGPIGLVIATIGAAILVFVKWETVSRVVTETAAQVWAKLAGFLMSLWGGLGQAAQGLGQILLGALTLDVSRIQEGYQQMISGFMAVKDTMVTAAVGIVSGVGSVVTKLKDMALSIGGVRDEMKKLREENMQAAQEIVDVSTMEAAALQARLRIHEEERRLAEEAAIAAHDAAIAQMETLSMVSEAERESLLLREESNRMAEAGIMLLDAQAKAALTAGEAIRQFNESVVATFRAAWDAVVAGVSQSVAQTIVFGGSLMDAMKNILQQVLANLIATLIQLAIQRLLTALGFIAATVKENIVRMAALTQQTFAGAFAATAAIPIIGPFIAPGVAAAATAKMLAGAAIASAAGAAVGAAVGGLAHGGIVTRPMTPLIGEAGDEAVIPLTGSRGRAALASLGGGGDLIAHFHFDGHELAKIVVPLIPGFVRVHAGIRTA